MDKLFIEDLSIEQKKVLMRVDFNVPLDGESNVLDATKIEASLPSIRYVLSRHGAVILMSHLGRPKHAPDPELSLAPVAHLLSLLLNKNIKMAPDCIGQEVEKMVDEIKMGEIVILENLRFHRAEEYPDEDPSFAKQLASFGDLYVNDAFGAAHRKHSSTYTITQYFPGRAAAGYLMFKEIKYLGETLQNPKRPFYAILGGAKVSTKLGVVNSLLRQVDKLLVGGVMAYTFLKSIGSKVGKSPVENELLPQAKALYTEKMILPIDCVASQEISEDAKSAIFSFKEGGIPDEYQGLDIGPATLQLFTQTLKDARTIFWNGPVGVNEIDQFAKGTTALGEYIADLKATKVVGGGDLIAALNPYGFLEKMSHVSTGGGATLEYLEFGTLPGIEALSDKKAHV